MRTIRNLLIFGRESTQALELKKFQEMVEELQNDLTERDGILRNERKRYDVLQSEHTRLVNILETLRSELQQKNFLVNKVQRDGAQMQHGLHEILDLFCDGADSDQLLDFGGDLTFIENQDGNDNSVVSAVDFGDYDLCSQDSATIIHSIKHEICITKQKLKSEQRSYESEFLNLRSENSRLKHDMHRLQHLHEETTRTLRLQEEEYESHFHSLKLKESAYQVERQILMQSISEKDSKIGQLENDLERAHLAEGQIQEELTLVREELNDLRVANRLSAMAQV